MGLGWHQLHSFILQTNRPTLEATVKASREPGCRAEKDAGESKATVRAVESAAERYTLAGIDDICGSTSSSPRTSTSKDGACGPEAQELPQILTEVK